MAYLRCLLKLADRIDQNDELVDDENGAFEDCEIESDDGIESAAVIDID